MTSESLGAAAPAPSAPAMAGHRLLFTSNASEYFGIWIVNILLTVVTFGIYSAWAKVRRMRFFYGHTEIAGTSLEYHGDPVRILIGRIIAFAILVVYNVMLELFPIAGLALLGVLIFVFPFLIQRSIRFNARVTSWRNVHFDFHGSYWGAFAIYVLGGLMVVFTLGLTIPLLSKWTWRYVMNNMTYGGRPFACDPAAGAMYRQAIVPFLMAIGASVLLAGGAALIFMTNPGLIDTFGDGAEQIMESGIWVFFAPTYAAILALYLIISYVYAAGVRNVGVSATIIDGRHRLTSAMGRFRYAWIALSNLFVTLITFGLARPWAAVRAYRYSIETITLTTSGSLDDYVNKVAASGNALGDAYMDLDGVDFGL